MIMLYTSEFANELVLPISIISMVISVCLYSYMERSFVLSSFLQLKKKFSHR